MIRPSRIPPGPGQESVWDYPRPPAVVRCDLLVEVVFAGVVMAASRQALRVLETSHPPVFYIPGADVNAAHLRPTARRTFCEWKGTARYLDVIAGDRSALAAVWCYQDPTPGFEVLRGACAFYAGPMDVCRVGGHVVQPQPGRFYGGWITPDVVGPFKGEPGSEGW